MILVLIVLVVIALSIAVFKAAYDEGRAEGYREGCRDCERGVIPQHKPVELGSMTVTRVFGAEGTVTHEANVSGTGISESEVRQVSLEMSERSKPRHLRSVPAEDDPEDGA